jgi:hypothetical protein
MSIGTLYLIPIPIAEGALQTLSPDVARVTSGLKHYLLRMPALRADF